MAAEPQAKKSKTEGGDVWTHACQDAIHFRLVESTTAEGLKKEIAAGGIEFQAEFFHQHFGDDEVLKGYKNLEVNVWMSAQTYVTWLEVKFTQKKLGADKIEKVGLVKGSQFGFGRQHWCYSRAASGTCTHAAEWCLLVCVCGFHATCLPCSLPLQR